MKAKQKLIKHIILLTSAVVMSTITIGSFAWFSKNMVVNDQGNNDKTMALAYDDTTATYEVYRYDTTLNKGVGVDENGDTLNISSIDFTRYDTILLSRNRYTPIFARVEVTKLKSMPQSGNISLTIHRNTLPTDNSLEKLDDTCSSVMRFTAFVSKIGEDNITSVDNFEFPAKDDTNEAKLYTYIDSIMYNNTLQMNTNTTSSKTFSTKSGNVYTKDESITLTLPYQSTDFYSKIIDGETRNVINMYLYITYDKSCVDNYTNDHDMKITSLDDTVVDFTNDLTEIKVSYSAT